MKRNGQANTNTIFQERTIDNVTTSIEKDCDSNPYQEAKFRYIFVYYPSTQKKDNNFRQNKEIPKAKMHKFEY